MEYQKDAKFLDKIKWTLKYFQKDFCLIEY